MVWRNLLRFRIKIHRVLLPWIYLVWIIWSFYPIIDILTIRLVAEKRKEKHGIDYVIFQLVRILKFKNLLYLSKWRIRGFVDFFFWSIFYPSSVADFETLMAGGNFMHRVISYVVNEVLVNSLANRYYLALMCYYFCMSYWLIEASSSGHQDLLVPDGLVPLKWNAIKSSIFLCTVIFMHCNCGSLRTFSHYNINVFLCLVFAWLHGHLWFKLWFENQIP